jgi:hypothetical protein
MIKRRFTTYARAASTALVIAAIAVTGCGGKSSKKSTTAAKPPATSSSAAVKTANQQFQAAVDEVNTARNRYTTRADADAKAGNIPAFQGDAAQYRTAVFNFDVGSVRKIQFPPELQTDVNSVLDATKTLVADLDAIGAAHGISEVNRLNQRANADFLALKSVGNKLYHELDAMAKRAGP